MNKYYRKPEHSDDESETSRKYNFKELYMKSKKRSKQFVHWASKPKNFKRLLCAVGIVIVIVSIISCNAMRNSLKQPATDVKNTPKPTPQIISESALEDIIKINELSTYETQYNGIATVMNDNDTEKIDYHISYKAKVKVGIDISQIDIYIVYSEENNLNTVVITLPEVTILDTEVDTSELEYMVINNKSDTLIETERAFKACNDDVKNESSQDKAIFEFAKQNAENIIEGLIQPFFDNENIKYKPDFKWEGENE